MPFEKELSMDLGLGISTVQRVEELTMDGEEKFTATRGGKTPARTAR